MDIRPFFDFAANATNPLFLKIFRFIPRALKRDIVELQKFPTRLTGSYSDDVFEACIAWNIVSERFWLKYEVDTLSKYEMMSQYPRYADSMLWMERTTSLNLSCTQDALFEFKFSFKDFNGENSSNKDLFEKISENSYSVVPDDFLKIAKILTSDEYARFREDKDMKMSIDEILSEISLRYSLHHA